MSVLSEKAHRCLEHYTAVYVRQLHIADNGQALEECLQHFLDQRPASKGLSSLDRATGLAAAPFWRDACIVNDSKLAALALSRILRHESAIDIEQLVYLGHNSPDTLRWAIRFSKLFVRRGSQLWTLLRQRLAGDEWDVFFGVCDRLIKQLEPFDALIRSAEERIAHLSLLETMSYLSVLAYEQLIPNAPDTPVSGNWDVYNRIISNKLKTCGDDDFALGEASLAQSLKQHLSPILFPSPSITLECIGNLEAVAALILATQERIDYEGSIDWFCFDPECRYQLKPGEPVIYNETDQGSRAWQRTERKSQALWRYWMNRGVREFVAQGMAEQQIGSRENHELNALAYIKALRSKLQLREIYGLDEAIDLAEGGKAELLQILLASELHSAFFQSAYVQTFQQHYADCGVLVLALSKLAFNGVLEGENRFPMTWAEENQKIERITGWTVCSDHPHGSRHAAKAILSFWTNDLKKLSNSLKEQPSLPIPTLYERPFYKIGRYNFQFPWVVAQQNNLTAAVNNLRRIGARRSGRMSETRQIEERLAEQMRLRGFTVVVGYQPQRNEQEDPGEIDLICCRDGLLFLLEVKSGYIRSTKHEVWLHRNSTLRKAAWQLRRKRSAVMAALQCDEFLRTKLGCPDAIPDGSFHSWIVDTSIELDEQRVDGFLVVSLEALQIILRDERHLLRHDDELLQPLNNTLFPDGFTAARLVDVVETGEIWNGLT